MNYISFSEVLDQLHLGDFTRGDRYQVPAKMVGVDTFLMGDIEDLLACIERFKGIREEQFLLGLFLASQEYMSLSEINPIREHAKLSTQDIELIIIKIAISLISLHEKAEDCFHIDYDFTKALRD